jgi:hypothetical protein
MGQANQLINTIAHTDNANMIGEFSRQAAAKIAQSTRPIQKAKQELLKFLSSEG